MRMFSFPAMYDEYAEGKIAAFVESIRQDIWRRGSNMPPLIPDFAIHPEKTGTTLVVFDVPAESADGEPPPVGFADRSQTLRRSA